MRRPGFRWFLPVGLLLSLLLAGVVSSFASSSPDGLDAVSRQGCEYSDERITGGDCIARDSEDHEVGGPLADYRIAGVDNPYLSTGLAGVIGVLLVFGAGSLMFRIARRNGAARPDSPARPETADVGPPRDLEGAG